MQELAKLCFHWPRLRYTLFRISHNYDSLEEYENFKNDATALLRIRRSPNADVVL